MCLLEHNQQLFLYLLSIYLASLFIYPNQLCKTTPLCLFQCMLKILVASRAPANWVKCRFIVYRIFNNSCNLVFAEECANYFVSFIFFMQPWLGGNQESQHQPQNSTRQKTSSMQINAGSRLHALSARRLQLPRPQLYACQLMTLWVHYWSMRMGPCSSGSYNCHAMEQFSVFTCKIVHFSVNVECKV